MSFAHINPRADAEAGATYHVEYEGEKQYHDGNPIEIDFLGVESATAKRAMAEAVKAADKGKGKARDASKMSVEEILASVDNDEKVKAKFLAELTTGWRNLPYIEDDKLSDPKAQAELLPYSKENALKFFSTRPWFMSGADAFLGDKANWAGNAKKA